MFIGLKHPRGLSVLFVILNSVPLKVRAHYAHHGSDGGFHIIADPFIIENKSTYTCKITEACKDYDTETFVWGLGSAYEIIDKAIKSIYNDEELIEAVSKVCWKYENLEFVDLEKINTTVKEILNKRDWLDENDSLIPYLIYCANEKHSIFSKLKTCKDVKDWMQTKEFKNLVASE